MIERYTNPEMGRIWTLQHEFEVMLEVGHNSVIGAGSLVTEHKKLPNNSMLFGSPVKVVRALREDEIEALHESALHYKLLADGYKE